MTLLTLNPWPLIGYALGWFALAIIAVCIFIVILGAALGARDTIRKSRQKKRQTQIIAHRGPSE